MSSVPIIRSIPLEGEGPARLELKPEAPVTGFVDGGWWPRSRDLVAEASALMVMLKDRLGHVESVSYHLGDWGPTPRRITSHGRLVRLAGYHTQRSATVDVWGPRRRLTLLVVPPETAPQAAHAVLTAAGRRGNTDGPEALLRIAERVTTAPSSDEEPRRRSRPRARPAPADTIVTTPSSTSDVRRPEPTSQRRA